MALDRIDVLVDQKPFTWKLVNSLWIAPIVVGMGIFSLLVIGQYIIRHRFFKSFLYGRNKFFRHVSAFHPVDEL